MQLRPLDVAFPIDRQVSVSASPVVLVNIFTVEAQDAEALLKAWEADANWMKKQPGFISTQLHKGIGESCVFLNYAVWQSVEDFRQAFTQPDFRKHFGAYPESAVASPHLFKKRAVPNLCVE
jgi:heme-degrading monooxygenase HmoA